MGEMVGHSVLPIARPGGSWTKGQRKSIDAPLVSSGASNTHKVINHKRREILKGRSLDNEKTFWPFQDRKMDEIIYIVFCTQYMAFVFILSINNFLYIQCGDISHVIFQGWLKGKKHFSRAFRTNYLPTLCYTNLY